MTPAQASEMLRTLSDKALAIEDLHEWVRTSGSTWSPEQLRLFLLCAPGVVCDEESNTFQIPTRSTDNALRDAIVEAVRSFQGRPIPAAQVRSRLPNDFVTTDEQILAIARRTSGIEVFGPNLIRMAR